MTDFRLKQFQTQIDAPTFDWFVRDIGEIDDREELATAVRVALGSDALANDVDVLPDPDSTDRRGWWGDLDAAVIWNGWPLGCKNWLLSRSKISDSFSFEGSTLVRAKQYTFEALQPFITQGMASQMDISAAQIDINEIEVSVVLYRGPLEEIVLRFQTLWEEDPILKATDGIAPVMINTLRRIPYLTLALSPTAPTVVQTYNVVNVPKGNITLNPTAPTRSP